MSLSGILGALGAGLLVGAVNFWLLWWTVRAVASARRPAPLLAVSGLIRVILVAGVVVLVGFDSWPRLLAALAGFLLARLAAVRRVGRLRGPTVEPRATAGSGDGDHA